MKKPLDAIFATVAALLVMFSAMWDLRVSLVVAVMALVVLATYEYMRPRRTV